MKYLLLSLLAQWGGGEDAPKYEGREGVSGRLVIDSTEGLEPLAALWGRQFAARHRGVKLKGPGPPNVFVAGAPMDAAARSAWSGQAPTALRVAMDAVAVFVHKDNPLDAISLDQLEAVYSGDRRHRIETWGSLGLGGAWADRRIVAWRRAPDHTHCEFFKERVLRRTGAFHELVRDDDAGIVRTVAIEPAGIGFAAVGSGTSDVKTLRVATRTGAPPHGPEDTPKRTYPLGRYLYVYVDRTQALPAELARYALSREGQLAAMAQGWLPLPADVASQERAKLE